MVCHSLYIIQILCSSFDSIQIIETILVLSQDLRPAPEQLRLNRERRDLTAYNVTYYLYTYGVNDTLLEEDELDELDTSLPFVFFIHGWESSAQTNTDIPKMADAYLNNSDINFIAVDWSAEANELYTVAVEYVESVG